MSQHRAVLNHIALHPHIPSVLIPSLIPEFGLTSPTCPTCDPSDLPPHHVEAILPLVSLASTPNLRGGVQTREAAGVHHTESHHDDQEEKQEEEDEFLSGQTGTECGVFADHS